MLLAWPVLLHPPTGDFIVKRKIRLTLILFVPALAHAGGVNECSATSGNVGIIELFQEANDGSIKTLIPFQLDTELGPAVDRAVHLIAFGYAFGIHIQKVEIIKDPSFAFNYEFTNPTLEDQLFSQTIAIPIEPLPANTVSAELNINLIDTNNDGAVFLDGNFGGAGNIQDVRLRNSTTFSTEDLGPPVGTDIATPGLHTFTLDPFAGPTPADMDQIVVSTRFSLSPGDTVRLWGQYVIDEGTGIPIAQVPELPNPANGPFFNVINVDSAETSLPEDFTIGPQTQVNLFDGGEIGHALEAGQTNANEFQFDFDIEVNVSGGVIRRLENFNEPFRAHGNSIVNLSGGTIEYLSAEHESVINVSGGRIGADNGTTDSFEAFFTSDNAVANISGGFVEEVTAVGDSVVNMTDGSIGEGTRGVNLRDHSVLNLSGGTVARVTANDFSGDAPLANIMGGNVSAGVSVSGSGAGAHVSDGSTPTITATNGSRISILGGTVSDFATSASGSTANIAGGAVGAVRALTGSTLNLFGHAFLLDGVPIDGLTFGEAMEVTERDMTLSGTLADGTAFSFELHSDNMAPTEFDWVHPDALLTVTLIGIPGDYNNDGVVDARDYTVWQDHLGAPSGTLPNDVDGGEIGRFQYLTWVANFGATAGTGNSHESARVPEPGAFFLALIGTMFVAIRSPR